MAANIASLAATVGANIAGFVRETDKMEQQVKAKARAINNTRMTARVVADTKPAKAHIEAFQKQVMNKPITLGMALASGALMRALTQSDKGKELLEQIDRVTISILEPLLANLTPTVAALVPVAQGLGNAINQLNDLIPTMPGATSAGTSVPTTQSGFLGAMANFFTNTWRHMSAPDYLTNREPISLSGLFSAGPVAANTQALNAFTNLFRSYMGMPAAGPTGPMIPTPLSMRQAPPGWLAALQGMSGGVQAQIAGMQPGATPASTQLAAATAAFGVALAEAEFNVTKARNALNAAASAGLPVAEAFAGLDAAIDASVRLQAAYNAELVKARAAQEALARAQREAALRQQAEALNVAALSPFEVFQNRMAELNRLMETGALTSGGFNTAAVAAFQQLQSSVGGAPGRGVGFAQQGSVEAQAAINAFNRQGGRNIQQEILDTLNASRRNAAATAENTAEMAAALARAPTIRPGGR